VLTGIAGGAAGADGAFPEGTINQRVSRRLRELADRLRRSARPGRDDTSREEGRDAAATTPADEADKDDK
jgi:hypothetical protein